jgi:beta-carotene hydroxylase
VQVSQLERAAGRVKIDRSFQGAPRSTINGTVCLFALTAAVLAVGWTGYLTGRLPAWGAVAVNALGAYLAFTVGHESVHRLAHRRRTVNDWLGRLAMLSLPAPYALFRSIHLQHHAYTNDAERDPDFIASRRPRVLMPLWLLGILFEYRLFYFSKRLWKRRAELIETVVHDGVILAIVVASLLGGWFGPLFVLWIAPAAVAVLLLGFFFDFLPHYPYDSQERYLDTRIQPSRVANVLLLGQNYHLIHHSWVTVPWYRYKAVYESIAPELDAHGARLTYRAAA